MSSKLALVVAAGAAGFALGWLARGQTTPKKRPSSDSGVRAPPAKPMSAEKPKPKASPATASPASASPAAAASASPAAASSEEKKNNNSNLMVPKKDMSEGDWLMYWQKNCAPWQQEGPHPVLVKYLADLADMPSDKGGSDKGPCFLVPLCGKTVDVAFLARQGARKVIGVELAERALRDLCTDAGWTPAVVLTNKVDDTPGGTFIRRFEPESTKKGDEADKRAAAAVQLFQCNLFAKSLLDEIAPGSVDAIFDRASLVAINVGDRKRYADLLATLLRRGGRILLSVFDYDAREMHGPPHSIVEDTVRELYGKNFEVRQLKRESIEMPPRWQERGLKSGLFDAAYLLTKK